MPHGRDRAHRDTMGTPRVFALGWDRPSMRLAADWLAETHPRSGGLWDLSAVTVVTSGGRSARILEAMILERAEADAVGLLPPMRFGPGEVADLVVERAVRPASPVVRRLAWIRALRETPATELAPLVRALPEADAHLAAIAGMLEHTHAELAGESVLFREVPGLASSVPSFDEADRWMAAAAVQDRYLEILARDGWADADADRIRAVREGRVRTHDGPIVLVGVADLPGVARAALQQGATDVACLVFAPDDLMHHFDAWGSPDGWWAKRTASAITHDAVRFADDPADQAAAAIEAIGQITPSPTPGDVVIGVPDASVVPAVRRWLAELGAWGRPASGTPASATPPLRLIEAVADALEDPSWPPFAALVRHPDAVRWIDDALDDRAGPSWLIALDDHAANRVPRVAMGSADDATDDDGQTVASVLAAVRSMLGDLASGASRPLASWMDPIAAMIDRVYPLPSSAENDGRSREIEEALDAVAAVVEEVASLAATSMDSAVSAARALRIVAEYAGAPSIPEIPRDDAVDLVGWLELAADPASIVIVTGMNEGAVPAAIAHHAMVPDTLRRGLSLADDARRLARDAYLMELIARQGRQTRFIVGRRSSDGEPLVPSRLVLRAPKEDLPAWVRRFTAAGRDPHRPAPIAPPTACGGADLFPIRPILDPGFEVRSMRVTAFRDYIESPYLYYLRHVLDLGEASDAEPELSHAGFGSLVHEALRMFATHDRAGDGDPVRVERALVECLDEAARVAVGDSPALAARVQVEMARGRIRRFAPGQARRTAEGWVIDRVEWTAVGPDGVRPALLVDGVPMELRGKIDRIERHARTGEFAVLDFKTGEAALDPDRAHRTTRGEQPWKDLQLPLYSVLVAGIVGDAPVRLGYGVLSSDPPDDPFRIVDWEHQDIDDALSVARRIIRSIRNREVNNPGRARVDDLIAAALVRVDRDSGEDDPDALANADGGAA